MTIDLWTCVLSRSKQRDFEAKTKDMEEQLESLKKELEESRSRSDKGAFTLHAHISEFVFTFQKLLEEVAISMALVQVMSPVVTWFLFTLVDKMR